MAIWHCNPAELEQNLSSFPRLAFDSSFVHQSDIEAAQVGLQPCPSSWHVLNATEAGAFEFFRRLAIHLIRRRPLNANEKSAMRAQLGKALTHAPGVNKYGVLRHTLHNALLDPRFVAMHSSTSRTRRNGRAWQHRSRPLWLEFGVFRGTSANVTSEYAKILSKKLASAGDLESSPPVVVGFDTFEGLPESWRFQAGVTGGRYAKGTFTTGGRLPPVRPGVRLVKGLFNETVPLFLDSRLPAEAHPVAWANVDCDLLSSSRQVLSMLHPRLRPGTRLHFHELLTSADWRWYAERPMNEPQPSAPLSDEALALFEWLNAHPVTVLQLAEVKSVQNSESAAFEVIVTG